MSLSSNDNFDKDSKADGIGEGIKEIFNTCSIKSLRELIE